MSGEGRAWRYPDIHGQRRPAADLPERAAAAGGAALAIEPVTVPLVPPEVEEIAVHRWIEIRRRPDRVLVALIELLSPSNKAEPGFSEYARKRQELIGQPIHLVELDFLIDGLRPPMAGPLPPGDFYAFVSRADRRLDCDVYAWSIRQPIPPIPLPLDPPDPDLPLGSGRGLCDDLRERLLPSQDPATTSPLGLPLSPDDLAWAEATARRGN